MTHKTVGYTEGAGKGVAVDEIGAVQAQRVKLMLGAEGVDDGDLSSSNPLPVTVSGGATAARQDTQTAALGAPTDAEAAGDGSIIAVLKRLRTLLSAALTVAGNLGRTWTLSSDTDSVAVSGTVTATGPLTDTQLRATAVPISGTVTASGPLTDTQLRATPVPVSGTITASGPLTDTQLRAAQVPVSGTVTANAGTNLNTSALALDVTLTGGNTKAVSRGGSKGTTTAADITSTASGANHNAGDVILYDASGNVIDPRTIRAIASGTDNITVVQGAAGASPWPITGSKTNNNAAPGATNHGAIIGIANEALASYTEGNGVMPAYDLRGALRAVGVPMANLGVYEVMFKSGTYAGLAANTPLFSFRWGDATRFAVLLRLRILVITSAAATAAGITERQLIIARSFSASDTGGTSVLPTGSSAKRRTSMGTTLMTDMRAGAPITAGTRTLDANPIASAAGWSGLLSTGLVIGASGGSAVGAARSTEGGTGMVDLFNALNGQDYPQTFAQNEGAVLRIGAAEPTGATQETWGSILWLEANKVL